MDPLAFDSLLQKTSPYQDPAARYPLVTEVSVPVSMSAFHQSSLTIDPVDQLLGLRQGDRSIEDYVQQFCELVYQVRLYDEALFKDLFRFGLSEPVKSRLPGGEVNVRLRDFMDYALVLCHQSHSTSQRIVQSHFTSQWIIQSPVTSCLPHPSIQGPSPCHGP